MDAEQCIMTRRSIRKFFYGKIPKEKMLKIIEAGRMAPTAGNLQNHEVIVVTDAGVKKAIADACLQQHWISTAPIIFVVVAEHEVQKMHYGKRGEVYSIQSAANVAMNMMLMANSLGIASCWVGAFDDDMLRRALSIPGKVTPLTVIPMGEADEKVPVPPRKSFYSTIWLESYGNQIRDVDAALGQWSGVLERKVKKAKETAEKQTGKLFDKIKGKIKEKISSSKK